MIEMPSLPGELVEMPSLLFVECEVLALERAMVVNKRRIGHVVLGGDGTIYVRAVHVQGDAHKHVLRSLCRLVIDF